jgi:hypothetical protein
MQIVAEAMVPGAVVSQIARRWQICPSQVFTWRRAARGARSAEPRPARRLSCPLSRWRACRRWRRPGWRRLVWLRSRSIRWRQNPVGRRGQYQNAHRGAECGPGGVIMMTIPAEVKIMLATRPVDFRGGA